MTVCCYDNDDEVIETEVDENLPVHDPGYMVRLCLELALSG